MRFFSLFGLLAALLLTAPAADAGDDQPWSCRDALTFRWAGAGEAPEPGLRLAGDLDTRSPPFLIDPKILSVTPVRDVAGPHIEIGFGPEAAATLAGETRDHAGETMIIMLGSMVLASPRVMEQLGDGRVVALYMPFDPEPLRRLVETLQQKAGGCAAPDGS